MDFSLAADPPGDELSAAPGVAVGLLMIIAAILWFSPYNRWKAKKGVMWLVAAAIAMVFVCGYLGIGTGGVGS